jgi:hypothetical protein
MITMDVFNSSAFSAVSLTGAINQKPFVPSFLGDLGLFTDKPIRTTAAVLESMNGTLTLVPTTPRGAPLPEESRDKRVIKYFETVRIAKGATITAAEIQNVRAFGSETDVQQVANEVAALYEKISFDIQLTWENMRLGAVQGIVLDADGTTTLNNWFTNWGIVQPNEVDWDLDNITTALSGAIRNKCSATIRTAIRALGGLWVPGRSYLMGLCGDTFFDQLTQNQEVKNTYLATSQAADLRENNAPFETFRYGGITWVNYRGTDDTTTTGINTLLVKFVPVNVPGLFECAWAPAETFDFVNTPGKPLYAIPVKDLARNAWQRMELYSYPLHFCTRPAALLRGKNT